VIIHRGRASAKVLLPVPRPGHDWHVLRDSSHPRTPPLAASPLVVGPRAVVLLGEQGSD
jgi:hypothetical protein